MMKKLAIGVGVSAGILAIGVVIFYRVENHRGREAWEAFQQELAERGETLDIAHLIPPNVPDDENFAAIPVSQEPYKNVHSDQKAEDQPTLSLDRKSGKKPSLGKANMGKAIQLSEWKTYLESDDLRVALEKFSPVLEEVSNASQRPHTRFPVDYEKGFSEARPFLIQALHLSSILTLRAEISISEGKPIEAKNDVLLVLRLSDAVTSDPIFISDLVQNVLVSQALGIVWHGLILEQWKAEQLREIKAGLGKIDLVESVAQTIRGERACGVKEWELMRANPRERIKTHIVFANEKDGRIIRWIGEGPTGWLYQNQVIQGKFYQQLLDALAKRPIDIEALAFKPNNPRWYYAFAEISNVAAELSKKAVVLQNRVQQGIIACALAEYRNKHAQFPSTLEALVPQFLEALPLDLLTGNPFIYKPNEDGTYLLYSVGLNLEDDGGKVYFDEIDSKDRTRGDDVWFSTIQNLTKKEGP